MRTLAINNGAVGVLTVLTLGASAARAADSNDLVTYTERRQACDARYPLRKAYFGDFHLHTSYSFDAFAGGTRNDPVAAFAYARGEPITIVSAGRSETIQLSRPLDFAGITDHAEFLGVFDLCTQNGSPSFRSSTCRRYRDGRLRFPTDEHGLRTNDPSNTILSDVVADAWARSQQAVDGAYDRTSACTFTAFNAFEYSATPGGNMNHRNVIFRNNIVPTLPIGFVDEPTPQGLWDRLDAECVEAETGCDVLAIPHNPNYSSGLQFEVEDSDNMDLSAQAEQARQRARLEPLLEIYQHKGASECSPLFSRDEQCSFEIIEQSVCEDGSGGPDGQILDGCSTPLNFARGILAQGLAEKERIGVNPYKLGIIASTDSHNANPGSVREDSWIGSAGAADADVVNSDPEFSPAGLVGVWSVENSRDAIFEALRRRETFGTSGPRIEIRLFAGWDYPRNLCNRENAIEIGYSRGVPMGGTMRGADASQTALERGPTFAFQAINDSIPLQVAQIIKLWVDNTTGELQERVYDVAGRRDNGASVDLATCQPSGKGATSMCSTWRDPDFVSTQAAVYYARVLQNPTCRWIQYACNDLPATEPTPDNCANPSVAKTVQERAWSSPIWYEPPSSR